MSERPVPDLGLSTLADAYRRGEATPAQVCADIRARATEHESHKIWIHLCTEAEQAGWLRSLEERDPASHSLWGIPFAVKDNIDVAELTTTAACEAFAYVAGRHASVVKRLLAAGAILVGKTNLDQFATGLNGTRSPYGACRNSHDPDHVSGGSSAGSAVAVALGLASFSLGTDTAGSGRVPAGFNDLVGLKPTRGLVPATGVVPACRSLDCVSVFAGDTVDADAVLAVLEGVDEDDGYGRRNPGYNAPGRFVRHEGSLRLAIVAGDDLRFFGDDSYAAVWRATLRRLRDDGAELVPLDFAPFDEIARLLYEGPWVAERHVATEPLIDENPDAMFPVVRDIIRGGASPLARDYFRAEYRLRDLAPRCLDALRDVDALLTPTAGRLFTIEEMLDRPIARNSELGYYTNFVNLLDLAALAVPAGFTDAGLPFGVTLVGPAFSDRWLLSVGRRLEHALAPALVGRRRAAPDVTAARSDAAAPAEGATSARLPIGNPRRIDLLVCGAHLSGMPLEHQLIDRGAIKVAQVRTAPMYRLYALAGPGPARPGLRAVADGGAPIEAEVWSVPVEELGDFMRDIPAPLAIGRVSLEGGTQVAGFVCEERGFDGAEDITAFGGWRAWCARGG